MNKIAKRIMPLFLALALVLPSSTPRAEDTKPARYTSIAEMTARTTVHELEGGGRVVTRVFKDFVPWEDYLAALATEEPSSESAPSPSDEPLVCTPPADGDYDGDGILDAEDSFPFFQGEYIADQPVLHATFESVIEPGLSVRYTETNESIEEGEIFYRDQLTLSNTVSDTYEITHTFNGKAGLKLSFGLGESPFSFSFSSDLDYQLNRVRRHSWEREKTHETEARYQRTRTMTTTGEAEILPDSGYVRSDALISNISEYDLPMDLSSVHVAVRAFSPFTGASYAVGDFDIEDTHHLGWEGAGEEAIGGPFNSFSEFVPLDGLNAAEMLDRLAEGWVFDMEITGGFVATTDDGEYVHDIVGNIAQRTAPLRIYDGGPGAPRNLRIAVTRPSEECQTAQQLLVVAVSEAGVDFDRREDGTLVVTRIGTKENRWADVDFDDLTPEQQAEFGKWVVGYDFSPANEPLVPDGLLVLDETPIAAGTRLYFYYLTAEDFRDEEAPPDAFEVHVVANDGSAPESMLYQTPINRHDEVELDVTTSFVVEEAFSEYRDDVGYVPNCGSLYNATWHGHRVAQDSETDNVVVSGPDWYGMEVRFGANSGTWQPISDLLAMPEIEPEFEAREIPGNYGYTLKFRADPALLDGFPTRVFEIRNVKPRQSFYTGYTGYLINGRHVDCRQWETVGFFRNVADADFWFKLDNADLDLDGFYATGSGGLDFDETSVRRFSIAPEHLDGIDNNGDDVIDNGPLLCATKLKTYESATCRLDDRMGWYEPSANVQLSRRDHFSGGGTSDWQDLGPIGEGYTVSMPNDASLTAIELRAEDLSSGFAGSNFIEHDDEENAPFQVGQEIDAEYGFITYPMETRIEEGERCVAPANQNVVPGGQADYRVRFTEPGDYVVWSRIHADTGTEDSFFVSILNPYGSPVHFEYGTQAAFHFGYADPPYPYGQWGWTRVGHYDGSVTPNEMVYPIYWRIPYAGVFTVRFEERELGALLEKVRIERVCADRDGDGWTTCDGDCKDKDPNIHPGHPEVCRNRIDDDCDGLIDEGCGIFPHEESLPGDGR